MKHLLSLAAALAATAALFLALPGATHAGSTDATTIPDPSGYATCNGMNQDGTTATWTVGGSIAYSQDAGLHYTQGYKNISPFDIPYAPYDNGSCFYSVHTSSNIKPGCAAIGVSAVIYYTPYGGNKSLPQGVSDFAISTPNANAIYSSEGAALDFSKLFDVISVQYKAKTTQFGSSVGEASTPYL